MGTWVYIRGWLEFNGQRSEAERIIREGNSEGWTFPEGGWLDAACYARAVRAIAVDDVLDQIRRISSLPATDEDNDRVCGLFFAFHEVDGQSEWQVRNGEVFISPAAPRYDYLWK
ncbi:hypothetical protein Psi02_04380 [Planotetraspora silvatica]|uniref:Uncharacterized protein n=1 Tax=Planotetraspora silvatica TaxID=234614 RepID=A0A8J3XK19_9ACTN|nr:hypothetical protein [Planotetraspora silvatica]GII44014.1 hypothetical protein Psi02_04380 [Planotetraspora silvatica]